jgi:hypothetical protein
LDSPLSGEELAKFSQAKETTDSVVINDVIVDKTTVTTATKKHEVVESCKKCEEGSEPEKGKCPCYNFPNEQAGLYCYDHKEDGMINLLYSNSNSSSWNYNNNSKKVDSQPLPVVSVVAVVAVEDVTADPGIERLIQSQLQLQPHDVQEQEQEQEHEKENVSVSVSAGEGVKEVEEMGKTEKEKEKNKKTRAVLKDLNVNDDNVYVT